MSHAKSSKKVPLLPAQKAIEEDFRKRTAMWSRLYEGAYPLPALDFLVNHIGVELENAKGLEEDKKDADFYNPTSNTAGLTNGEFYYSLYRTLERMLKEKDFTIESLTVPDQQILAATIEVTLTMFMDYVKSGEREMLVLTAREVWVFYSWLRRKVGEPVWESESGDEMEPPDLNNLNADDWDMIMEEIQNHFVTDSDIKYIDIALSDEQPHWPSEQEYRKAKGWLLEWFSLANPSE